MTEYKGGARDANRVLALAKKREQAEQALEDYKKRIEKDNEVSVRGITQKFAKTTDKIEEQLKVDTVGLVSLADFAKKREAIAREIEAEKRKQKEEEERRKQRKKNAPAKNKLSFSMDDGEENDEAENGEAASGSTSTNNEEPPLKKMKVGKNPDVDTSFLPDRERRMQELMEREKIRNEWRAEQEKIKNEEIDVTYSYWDGSGHRRNIRVKKGITIDKFLTAVQRDLANEFKEVARTSVDNLMFIKEDLIIPSHYTFYELIVKKARGKSGPLFHFDVHDDVRVVSDATVEKEESHAAKVVDRRWYERNKHIFPASRWEVYDPNKTWEKYTIHGGEVN